MADSPGKLLVLVLASFVVAFVAIGFIALHGTENTFSRDHLDQEMSEHLFTTEGHENGDKMINPWQTPIMQCSIVEWLEREGISGVEFHNELSSVIIQHFEQFKNETEDIKSLHSGAYSYGTNQLFYNCLLSGVYYVSVPEDNYGLLLLEDPRGPLPPFDSRVRIKPVRGDLILFPSWLPHQVTPTISDSPRISIAFNVPGSWETTTNLSLEYDL